jgi:threonine synthase
MAVNMARLFGVRAMAIPTNGNAGAAMAAYCARAGIEAHCYCPSDTPVANLREIELFGAKLTVIDGMIDDCGKLVAAGEREGRWTSCATLRGAVPHRGQEDDGARALRAARLARADAIFYPTGGGTGLIGMWKAFAELEALGWIGSMRPRMYAIQSEGCAPIVRAFDQGAEFATRWENSATVAHGIRVPQALGDFLILRAYANRVARRWRCPRTRSCRPGATSGARDGMLMCPEGAATLAGLRLARRAGWCSRASTPCCSTARARTSIRCRSVRPRTFPIVRGAHATIPRPARTGPRCRSIPRNAKRSCIWTARCWCSPARARARRA